MPYPQAKYWLLTIPRNDWCPQAPYHPAIAYIKGQAEVGAGGFEHWQVLVCLAKKTRLAGIKQLFTPTTHAEPAKSEAADQYVWKEATRVPDTQFTYGTTRIGVD